MKILDGSVGLFFCVIASDRRERSNPLKNADKTILRVFSNKLEQ